LPYKDFAIINRAFSFEELILEEHVNTIIKNTWVLGGILSLDENNVFKRKFVV
jgi:hypothetical protein